jgi:signal transduction histidine kinase
MQLARPRNVAARDREEATLRQAMDAEGDATRRTALFTAAFCMNAVAIALVIRLPYADRVLAPMSATDALVVALPAACLRAANFFLYRWWQKKQSPIRARLYDLGDALEYLSMCWMVYGFGVASHFAFSAPWWVMPFVVASWAYFKPNNVARHVGSICLVHATLILLLIALRFPLQHILICPIVGVGCVASCVWVAGLRRRSTKAEAARNVALDHLHAARLERERGIILRALEASMCSELAAISRILDDDGRRRAAGAVETMGDMVLDRERVADTALELSERIDDACKRLCQGHAYRIIAEGRLATRIRPTDALAALRISQELVHNAVMHANCTRIVVRFQIAQSSLSISVEDDGGGLSSARLRASTSGLHNARSWLTPLDGTIERLAVTTGTHLRVRLPNAVISADA